MAMFRGKYYTGEPLLIHCFSEKELGKIPEITMRECGLQAAPATLVFKLVSEIFAQASNVVRAVMLLFLGALQLEKNINHQRGRRGILNVTASDLLQGMWFALD